MRNIRIILILVLVFITSCGNTDTKTNTDIVDVFYPINYVTDFGNYYTEYERDTIANWITNYESETSIEIAIVTLDSLGNKDQFDYSVKTFNRLGIGKKGANNGLLFLFSKKEKKISIRTGKGLEAILTDLECGKIRDNVIIPYFRKGRYYYGTIMALEYTRNLLGNKPFLEKSEWDKKQNK